MSRRVLYEAPRVAAKPGETVVTSTCGHNCGGRCVVNAHVRAGRIVKISTDPRKWTPEMPPLHACVRGFGQAERVHHPERLRHPLRRVGPRGSGQFDRIGWDEALDEVARQMLRVRDTYGPAAILDCSRTGSLSMMHNVRATAQRLLHLFGGCTELWSNISAEAEVFAVHMTYGARADYKSGGREPTDYVNSRLIVMWGWSPGDGTFGTGTLQYLKLARKNGNRIVCVDPRRTRTSHDLADEHVFIRPATDTAALLAMAYVIVTEGLHDQAFLDRYVLGFDEAHLPADAAAGYPADIKMVYSVGGDLFNQAPNVAKTLAAAASLEFMVVHDHFITPTARFADIVLPATTFWERNDVHTPWAGAGHYAIFMKQAIEPVGECRNDIDIFADLAGRVGIASYSDKSEMAWLRELTRDAVDDFDAFAENGVARFAAPDDAVAFAREIRDPERHRFTTPSGKIEIYSMALAANPDPYGLGPIPPIPTWVPPFREGSPYP